MVSSIKQLTWSDPNPPLRVNAIIDRLVKSLNHGSSCRTFFPYDFDPRRVNNFSPMLPSWIYLFNQIPPFQFAFRIGGIFFLRCFQFEICNLKFEIKRGPTFLGMTPNPAAAKCIIKLCPRILSQEMVSVKGLLYCICLRVSKPFWRC